MKLLNWRQEKEWSQQDLAEQLGVALQTVWRWENGESRPSPLAEDRLRKLGFEPDPSEPTTPVEPKEESDGQQYV